LERLVDATFMELQKKEGLCLLYTTKEIVDKRFLLVDQIYPLYSSFVKGIKEPISNEESTFTKLQESARKDIERASGVPKALGNAWTDRYISKGDNVILQNVDFGRLQYNLTVRFSLSGRHIQLRPVGGGWRDWYCWCTSSCSSRSIDQLRKV
jgi:hypothetical protein